jgi:hypothetical protein
MDHTFPLRVLLVVLASLYVSLAGAQDTLPTWQTVWQETLDLDDEEGQAATEACYDLLQDLADHPLDLNRATRQELEQLPFLSAQQVMDLQEYRDRYGPFRSVGELRMVRSMDYRQIALMPFFTVVGEVADTLRFPRVATIARYARHQLTASARVPFYSRQGDRNGYLGYKYRHWLHYETSYGDFMKAGVVGSQDGGEPFFTAGNNWGYDYYSYYLQLRHLGRIEQLVVGKYKLSAGMGLVMNNSFTLGKLATLQSLGRTASTIRVHASRSVADYLQGAAATMTLSRFFSLTAFASCRYLDATLNKDGSVATIVTDGYHRTPAEMQKKNNTLQTTAGARLTFRHNALSMGATTVYTHLDRPLRPNTSTLYRRYYATGRHFANASLDYAYRCHRLSLQGETAVDREGAVATVNALSYQPPSGSWSVVALQRFYSYRYTTLHGHAFSEGGRVQNESGCYIGASWQPLPSLRLQGYADVAFFPWARYRVSQSSLAKDFLAETVWTPSSRLELKGRYRLHLREMDNAQKTALRRHNEHRAQLRATYRQDMLTLTTQADMTRAANDDIDHGWMLSQTAGWQQPGWQLTATASYFHTDSYDSRIYAYERQLPHQFAMPVYYGRGMRLAVVARATAGRHWQADAKWGLTRRFDGEKTGSGLQQTDAPVVVEAELQLRYRF